MRRLHARRAMCGALSMLAACLLAACASSRYPAPVEERAPFGQRTNPVAPAAAPAPGTVPAVATTGDPNLKPGAENAGKPGYYTIKPGDTLLRVGLETGQNARDIARWNNIENPNLIEVGQVLRVAPPGADPGAPAARGVAAAKIEARPLDAKPAPTAASGGAGATALPPMPPAPAIVPVTPVVPVTANAAASGAAVPAAGAAVTTKARESDEEITWSWPAAGPVAMGFDDVKSKGLAITGKAGDPVLAAADGRVVYAGSGLRGYGNLVILKHNNTYLTAYAHNQALLVKEDQVIRRGQKIAEMGSSDADRVQLHFEIRRQGKPIDPARLLPPR
jgi:lipoprotein NlpD